ncbi:hypothetical protein [Streptomyces sp. URMC 129]|uniref:hypothetical protein n=1 Tax=Streptomyces sp. URMC 129 TaxID=3423407 RepID=UPI003F1DB863
MTTGDERTVPAVLRQGEWATVPVRRTVLAVVHTLAYAQRVMDVVGLLRADPRIQIVFTAAPHAFGAGVAEHLLHRGIAVVPWRQAVTAEFDLALAAGSQGIDRVRAPLIRLPHGAGHIKLLRRAGNGEDRTPGMLSRRHLVHDGRVVPAAIAFSHERDLRALARSCPEALPVATVVGDPCHDRIVAGLPRRAAYRRALGLSGDERLVVVASTWGRSAAFGHFATLLPRLLAELPGDRYRVVVLAHPNVWAAHGSWQIRGWLADSLRRGAVLVPPEADWEPLLIASDVIIGDHGSVTAYGTLTGVPILMACRPGRDIAADSPAAALAAVAPALSPTEPLPDQLRSAAERYRREDHQRIGALLSSEPGRFNACMRTLMYRLLGLDEPTSPPGPDQRPLPPPTA